MVRPGVSSLTLCQLNITIADFNHSRALTPQRTMRSPPNPMLSCIIAKPFSGIRSDPAIRRALNIAAANDVITRAPEREEASHPPAIERAATAGRSSSRTVRDHGRISRVWRIGRDRPASRNIMLSKPPSVVTFLILLAQLEATPDGFPSFFVPRFLGDVMPVADPVI